MAAPEYSYHLPRRTSGLNDGSPRRRATTVGHSSVPSASSVSSVSGVVPAPSRQPQHAAYSTHSTQPVINPMNSTPSRAPFSRSHSLYSTSVSSAASAASGGSGGSGWSGGSGASGVSFASGASGAASAASAASAGSSASAPHASYNQPQHCQPQWQCPPPCQPPCQPPCHPQQPLQGQYHPQFQYHDMSPLPPLPPNQSGFVVGGDQSVHSGHSGLSSAPSNQSNQSHQSNLSQSVFSHGASTIVTGHVNRRLERRPRQGRQSWAEGQGSGNLGSQGNPGSQGCHGFQAHDWQQGECSDHYSQVSQASQHSQVTQGTQGTQGSSHFSHSAIPQSQLGNLGTLGTHTLPSPPLTRNSSHPMCTPHGSQTQFQPRACFHSMNTMNSMNDINNMNNMNSMILSSDNTINSHTTNYQHNQQDSSGFNGVNEVNEEAIRQGITDISSLIAIFTAGFLSFLIGIFIAIARPLLRIWKNIFPANGPRYSQGNHGGYGSYGSNGNFGSCSCNGNYNSYNRNNGGFTMRTFPRSTSPPLMNDIGQLCKVYKRVRDWSISYAGGVEKNPAHVTHSRTNSYSNIGYSTNGNSAMDESTCATSVAGHSSPSGLSGEDSQFVGSEGGSLFTDVVHRPSILEEHLEITREESSSPMVESVAFDGAVGGAVGGAAGALGRVGASRADVASTSSLPTEHHRIGMNTSNAGESAEKSAFSCPPSLSYTNSHPNGRHDTHHTHPTKQRYPSSSKFPRSHNRLSLHHRQFSNASNTSSVSPLTSKLVHDSKYGVSGVSGTPQNSPTPVKRQRLGTGGGSGVSGVSGVSGGGGGGSGIASATPRRYYFST